MILRDVSLYPYRELFVINLFERILYRNEIHSHIEMKFS